MKNTGRRNVWYVVLLLLVVACVSGPFSVEAASTKLSKTKVTLIKGQTYTLKLKNVKAGTKVTWKSSNKKIAAVSAKGKITAKKKGTAKITATAGKNSYTCKVTVVTPKISKKSAQLTVGKTLKLKITGTSAKVKWTSSNKKVVTVSKAGKVTAKKAGSALITATVLNKKYTCQITVVPAGTNPQTPESEQPKEEPGTEKPEEKSGEDEEEPETPKETKPATPAETSPQQQPGDANTPKTEPPKETETQTPTAPTLSPEEEAIKKEILAVNGLTVDLMAVSTEFADYISLPANAVTSYQLPHGPGVDYRVNTFDPAVAVDKDGVVTPATHAMYMTDGFGTSKKPEDMTGYTVEYRYNFNEPNDVYIFYESTSAKVTFTVHDYCPVYYQAFIKETARQFQGMTPKDQVYAITKYVAENYDYSTDYSAGLGMAITGGGDCWASTIMIKDLATELGLRARAHKADWEAGAGYGHYNALVEADGAVYVCEAGYAYKKPRIFKVEPYESNFRAAYGYAEETRLIDFQSFDTVETVVIPSVLFGTPVTGISRAIFLDQAYQQNKTINKIVLPPTLKFLDMKAFYLYERPIRNFEMASESPFLTVDSNVLYSKDHKTLYAAGGSLTGTVGIHEDTETIRGYAFCGSNISKVVIGNNVQVIEEAAFWTSKKLQEVILPEGVQRIDKGAFADCPSCVITIKNKDLDIQPKAMNGVKKIRGYKGSTAETYAKENGIDFDVIN